MKTIKGNFTEDLERIGLAGYLSENTDTEEEKTEETAEEDAVSESKDDSTDDSKDESADESGDNIDGEYVSEELLTRIQTLPFDKMEEGDFDELISSMTEKQLAEDATDELKQLAEDTVKMVAEAKAQKIRRSAAHSMSKKKSFQCPEGFRQENQGGGSPRCVPTHRAAGGMGKVAKERREKAKWARSGKGAMSQKKSAKWAQRRESDESISAVALELRALVEDTETVKESISVRDELVGRFVSILELMAEEYNDADVTDIYEEHIEKMLDSYEIGRLDEDIMDESEFLAEMAPIVNLVKESYRKIVDGEELGN